MGLLELFIVASVPVLKVLLVTALGAFLALDNINLMGDDARRHLNHIVFYVFNPALVSSNLAKTITYDSMVKLWFMPVNILITYIIGSILGWLVIRLTKARTHLQGLIIGCCSAGNLGSLMLIIVPAVCDEKGSPFGDPSTCQTYALAYSSLSMATAAIFLWTYVFNIIRIYSRGSSEEANMNDCYVRSHSNEAPTSPLLPSEEVLSITEYHEDHNTLPTTRFQKRPQSAITDKVKLQIGLLLKNINLKKIIAPSTFAAIVGFVVGTVPYIRRCLIGDEAPLRVIQRCAVLLGEGSIPSLILITGGNLLRGLRGSGVQKSVIFGIIAARYIFQPLLGILVVKWAGQFGLLHSDPLFQFILLLQFAMPPAINIGTMTQLFGACESESSVIMLWTYSLASVSLTVWSTFFMWMVT